MFQVQIKTNDVISTVESNAATKKAAIQEVKSKNPGSSYVRCWTGGPPTTKSPVGPPLDLIKEKLKKKVVVSNGTND